VLGDHDAIAMVPGLEAMGLRISRRGQGLERRRALLKKNRLQRYRRRLL
jgi:hypothetical protein